MMAMASRVSGPAVPVPVPGPCDAAAMSDTSQIADASSARYPKRRLVADESAGTCTAVPTADVRWPLTFDCITAISGNRNTQDTTVADAGFRERAKNHALRRNLSASAAFIIVAQLFTSRSRHPHCACDLRRGNGGRFECESSLQD